MTIFRKRTCGLYTKAREVTTNANWVIWKVLLDRDMVEKCAFPQLCKSFCMLQIFYPGLVILYSADHVGFLAVLIILLSRVFLHLRISFHSELQCLQC